jgi:hypothetical protein
MPNIMNLETIVSILCPSYVRSETPRKLLNNVSIEIHTTKFEQNATVTKLDNNLCNFLSFYDCLVSFLEINNDLTYMLELMETHNFIDCFNIPKLSHMMTQNMINNELILFMSAYYNINIGVYNYETKIMQMYYIEDAMNTEKPTMILRLCDSKNNIESKSNKEYQIMSFKERSVKPLMKYIIDNILVAPIGKIENKKFMFGNNEPQERVILERKKELELLDELIFGDIDMHSVLDLDIETVKEMLQFDEKKLLKSIRRL